jgi:hypothetical protein
MWKECRTMFSNGETDELALMMETIKETFDEKELIYNAAVDDYEKNAPTSGTSGRRQL